MIACAVSRRSTHPIAHPTRSAACLISLRWDQAIDNSDSERIECLGSGSRKLEVRPPITHPLSLLWYSVFLVVGGQVIDSNGGRDRTRTCDLLRVKRGVHSTLLIVLAV